MMSLQAIQAESASAARKAAREKKTPFMLWPQDVARMKTEIADGRLPAIPFPFIGSYVPKGWREVERYFVDASGFGREGEPALTVRQFVEKLEPDYGYAITEAGQFQVYVGKFEKVKKG